MNREYKQAEFYSITDLGNDYLPGSLDVDDFEEPK